MVEASGIFAESALPVRLEVVDVCAGQEGGTRRAAVDESCRVQRRTDGPGSIPPSMPHLDAR